jgi:hypothetical protein
MLIYQIFNAAQSILNYVCDSQSTIDTRPDSIPANQCSIGGEYEANTILVSNQSAWLAKQVDLFTVNLQTAVEGGIKWIVVNLETQPPNTDSQYFVLDPTTGLYTGTIGLDATKSLFTQTQQTYLVFTDMQAYTKMTSWDQTSV